MKNNVRVVISRKPDKLIRLMTAILEKHKADGKDSPLNSIDLAFVEALLAVAIKEEGAAQQLRKDAEAAVQKRNLALGIARSQTSKTKGTPLFVATSVRNLLLGLFRGQEQLLGQWGFEVNTSLPNKSSPDSTTGTATK